MKNFFVIIILIAFSACVSGPKRENGSILSNLNGNNVNNKFSVGFIPLSVERKAQNTKIEGSIEVQRDALAAPLGNQIVILLSEEGKELARAHTDALGKFKFNKNISNGNYLIKLESKCFQSVETVGVSKYEISGLILKATAIPGCKK